MSISLRTPDGSPNRCPACGQEVPSQLPGDARCANCGYALWLGEGGTVREVAKVTVRRRMLKAGGLLALVVLALALFFFGATRLSALELTVIVLLAAVLFGSRWFNAVMHLRRFGPFRRR